MLDLDNDSMLGIFNKYNDENESIKEKEHIDEVDKLESTSNHIGKKELVSVVENTNHENPYIQRFCVIEPEDSLEISESIKDYYNAQVPLSMPLSYINRQIKRLKLEHEKYLITGKNLGCDMGKHPGSRALELLENQAFLKPHNCKRVLSTIRQNKFGQTFEASHVFTCL